MLNEIITMSLNDNHDTSSKVTINADLPNFQSAPSQVKFNLMENITNLKDELINLKDTMNKNLQDKSKSLKTKVRTLKFCLKLGKAEV